MSYLLFVDESGQDRRASPYEVLAGLAVEDTRIWNLITALQDAEEHFFGMRVPPASHELKARKLLKTKVYRQAGWLPPIAPAKRAERARRCRENGAKAGELEIAALAQAKLAYVERVLEICAQHQAKVIASIVDRDAPRPERTFLRKDYAYLFERFYYLLDEQPPYQHGIIVFDELEKTQSHILLGQMEEYFVRTATGRLRASRVLPEPLFVHSDLTTLIRVADYVAYIIAWGVRFGRMERPARKELAPLVDPLLSMRHRAIRDRDGEDFVVWSLQYIDDLRPRDQR